MHEVVAGDQGRLGRYRVQPRVGRVHVVFDCGHDVARCLHETAYGGARKGDGGALDRQFAGGAVLIVAQVVVALQSGARRRGRQQRRLVVRFGGQTGVVRVAEEGDDVVVTHDDDVLQIGGGDTVGIYYVLDRLGHQVLCVGAACVRRRLGLAD